MARLGPVPAEWGGSSSVYRTQGGSILVSFRRYFADLNMATLLIASRIMQRSQNRAFRQPFGVNTCPYRIRGYRPYSGSGKSVLRRECPLRNYLLTVCRPMIFAKLANGPIRRTSG